MLQKYSTYMSFQTGVQDFLAQSKAGMDLAGFYRELERELQQIQKEFHPCITIPEPLAVPQGSGPLCGLPVSVKDNICTRGLRTTAGSAILESYIPPYSATCVEAMEKAGGTVIGKTAMDEFAFGTFSTTCAFGIPKNPHDPDRSCGGSSGGAGCLTAALKLPHLAIAESTGGSITAPAAFCGVVGLTPTYGLVSRYGLIDYANSLDKIGVMGKTVWEAAFGLSQIAGYDPQDATSLKQEKKRYEKGVEGKKKLTVGVPKEYFSGGVEKGVDKAVWDAIKQLEKSGVATKKVSLPATDLALPAYYIIAMAEASTNLARYCGMRYGKESHISSTTPAFDEYFSSIRTSYFGEEAKRRILLGTFARMAGFRDQYYLKALKVRQLVINDFQKAFQTVDALVAPSMPVIAPKFSEIEKLTPLQNYMMDVLTVAPNLAGIPHLSVPCGTSQGMPVGLHIMGPHQGEETILKIGEKYEQTAKK